MSDERRPDNPFGGHRSSNGYRPDETDMPTTPIRRLRAVDESPIDLVAVQADEELINALAAGAPVTGSSHHDDDRVIAMLAAWRDEVDAEPIPELVDIDTAVAAVDAPRARARRRRLAPLVGAAALVLFAGTGVAAAAAQTAQPGDVFWGVAKVFNSERTQSVEAAAEVEARLDRAREAMASGETAAAAAELQAIEQDLVAIREEEGLSTLSGEQQRLSARLRETPPGTPTDPDAPANSATSAPGVPPVAPDTSERGSEAADPRIADETTSPDPTSRPTTPPSTATPAPSTPPTSEGSTEPEPTATREGSASSETSEVVPSGSGTVPEPGSGSASAPQSVTASGSATAPRSAGASGTVSSPDAPATSSPASSSTTVPASSSTA